MLWKLVFRDYNLTFNGFPIEGHSTVYVEADDADEAKAEAKKQYTGDDLISIEIQPNGPLDAALD